MGDSALLPYNKYSPEPVLFLALSMSSSLALHCVGRERLHSQKRLSSTSMMVVRSGCLSLVPYRLWQVFVLPFPVFEDNSTIGPS